MTAAVTAAAITLLAIAMPAFAQTGSPTPTPAARGAKGAQALQQRMATTQTKADQLIDQRITSLNALITRVQGLRNVSDAQKASVVAMVQSLMTTLTNLKAQIAADTSTTTLKNDTQSITQAYRVYALVIPQLNIVAASDRIDTIVSMMSTIGTKIQARLATDSTLAAMNSIQSALSDFSAKLTDAGTQAQTAVTEVTALLPDQGDKTKMASNTSALKDARSKIQTANKDLQAARKDVQTIIKALVKSDQSLMGNGTPKPTPSTTPSGTPSPSVTPSPSSKATPTASATP
jgi:hypothetical protein